jgi:hypothetical protein
MLKSKFILSIEIIPDFNPPILGDNKEYTLSSWRPTTISKIGIMEFGSHNWSPKLIMPDLGSPITYC